MVNFPKTKDRQAPSLRRRKLTSSKEDYLEAILFLARQNKVARVRDIAARLKVGMPSVTSALKALSGRGLVNYDPYQYVTLTARGEALAAEVTRRHEALKRFLVDVLGLESPAAESNACRMEHAMDDEVLDRLGVLAEVIGSCPGGRNICAKKLRAGASRSKVSQAVSSQAH